MGRFSSAAAVVIALWIGGCGDVRVEPARSAAPAPTARAPEPTAPPPVDTPTAEATLDADDAPTPAAAEIIRTIASLRDNVIETRYQGKRVVDADTGLYAWDCSGMAAWILRESAPSARRALRSGRPLAKRFFQIIDRAPTERARRGWQRLSHVSDARPGDVFSWLRSPASKSPVTGHVGFFVEQPQPLPDYPEIYAARIVDSTRLPHGEDTRARDGEGGFGFGTMLFLTDADTGETIAYGWHGVRSLEWGFMPARVIYGRVTK
jgi:hypothetical protein